MRTIKASEVRKGMRVRVSTTSRDVTKTTEGGIHQQWHNETPLLIFDDGTSVTLSASHPVTVLAEPEPEWVEGAWYRFTAGGERWYLGRVENGELVEPDGSEYGSEYITVLGRVLIVDWPGDRLAKDLTDGASISRGWDRVVDLVAEAIRTQGGVR